LFRPGPLGIPLRAMARLPRMLGAVSCHESADLALIRSAVGGDAGLSCCRAGAPGPWSKETILFLSQGNNHPMYLAKAGTGEAVRALLQNESEWVKTLRAEPSLTEHVPELIAHHAGPEFCFVAQSVVGGDLDFQFGGSHIDFLRKLHAWRRQAMPLEETKLYANWQNRLRRLHGMLSESWSARLKSAIQHMERTLNGKRLDSVAAHNDFTPWNVRVERGVARVFDWEYADAEQLPLMDPIHFALLPLALKRRPIAELEKKLGEVLQGAATWFDRECSEAGESQALAYLVNLCTLYLCAESGRAGTNPVLECYGRLMDSISR